MAHQPAQGQDDQFPAKAILSKFGTENRFEIQLQIKLKAPVQGKLWLVAELRDGPMQLNLVSRALCKVLLGFIQKKATARGSELRYSFGDSDDYPSISVPALACDRIIVSGSELSLPVETPDSRGTWVVDGETDGSLQPLERSAVKVDTDHYYTFIFSTSHLDWNEWAAVNVPGVGKLDLEQFWGKQGVHVNICDDSGFPAKRRTKSFAELHISSKPGPVKIATPAPTQAAKAEQENAEEPQSTQVLAFEEAEEISQTGADEEEVRGNGKRKGSREFIDFDEPESGDEGLFYADGDLPDVPPSDSVELVRQLDEKVPSNYLKYGAVEDFQLAERGAVQVQLPWYFIQRDASQASAQLQDLWWCISLNGRQCWRHHSQVQALCKALGCQDLDVSRVSVQDLEHFRRKCGALLTRSAAAPGLLHEFLRVDISLAGLQKHAQVFRSSKAVRAGLVEAEGRIVQRVLRFQGGHLQWQVAGASTLPLKDRRVRIALKDMRLEKVSVADAPALKIHTAGKVVILVANEGRLVTEMMQCVQEWGAPERLRTMGSDDAVGTRTSSSNIELARSSAKAAASSLKNKAIQTKMLSKNMLPTKLREKGSKVYRRATTSPALSGNNARSFAPSSRGLPWISAPSTLKDPLSRWTRSHLVLNDIAPCLVDQSSPSPLALSAKLLRAAVAAQGRPETAVREVALLSCQLKCVDLTPLSPEELWGFWVNVYHSLRVHAVLALGHPKGFQQTVAFYNSASYVVAGHAFSLVEIEHSILRYNMTKPRVRFASVVLRIWNRSDDDLENRPCLFAPPCPASCFKCQADWRLNLALNPGVEGLLTSVPVFEPGSPETIERTIATTVQKALACRGSISELRGEAVLPYNLHRYRDDAPGDHSLLPERRWVKALVPEADPSTWSISYTAAHGWALHESLDLM